MDIASLGGILFGLAMVVFGILNSGGSIDAFWNFIDIPSVAITIGGSIGSTLACYKLPAFLNGLKAFTLIFKEKKYDPSEIIKSIIDLANVGRKDGLLALEEAANGLDDEFLKKGILLENTMNITTNEMKVSLKINKMVAGNLWVKENIKELEKLNYYKK